MPSSDTDIAHQGAWAYIKSLYQAVRDEFEDEDGRPVELEYQRMNTSVRRLGMLPPVNTLTFKRLARSTLTQHLPRTFSLGPNPRVYRSRKCTNLRAALIQATGHVSGAADECDRCSQGYGLWVGCVRAPDGFPNGMLPDCCANCLYNDQIHRCTPGPARKTITVELSLASSDAYSDVDPPALTHPILSARQTRSKTRRSSQQTTRKSPRTPAREPSEGGQAGADKGEGGNHHLQTGRDQHDHSSVAVANDCSPQYDHAKRPWVNPPSCEVFKTKFLDEIKRQLSTTATRLGQELADIRSRLPIKPDPDSNADDVVSPSVLAARIAALEQVVRVISELDDLSHTTIPLFTGTEACPDVQFRHEGYIPHFVFETGYADDARSLRDSARDYIEGTDEVKTIVTIEHSLSHQERRNALLRNSAARQRELDSPQYVAEAAADGVQPVIAATGAEHEQQDEEERDQDREPGPIDRTATLCLYRGERPIIRDAMIRDDHGTPRSGKLVLTLADFISDETVKRLGNMYPYQVTRTDASIHPSALLIEVSFHQLAGMLEKSDRHRDKQDTAPPSRQRARPKRKMHIDDETEVSTRSRRPRLI